MEAVDVYGDEELDSGVPSLDSSQFSESESDSDSDDENESESEDSDDPAILRNGRTSRDRVERKFQEDYIRSRFGPQRNWIERPRTDYWVANLGLEDGLIEIRANGRPDSKGRDIYTFTYRDVGTYDKRRGRLYLKVSELKRQEKHWGKTRASLKMYGVRLDSSAVFDLKVKKQEKKNYCLWTGNLGTEIEITFKARNLKLGKVKKQRFEIEASSYTLDQGVLCQRVALYLAGLNQRVFSKLSNNLLAKESKIDIFAYQKLREEIKARTTTVLVNLKFLRLRYGPEEVTQINRKFTVKDRPLIVKVTIINSDDDARVREFEVRSVEKGKDDNAAIALEAKAVTESFLEFWAAELKRW